MDNIQKISADETSESFYEITGEGYTEYNMTLPLQMLFDDIISFVTVADV